MIIHTYFIIRLRAEDKLRLRRVYFFTDDICTALKTELRTATTTYHYNICLSLMSAEAWMVMIHMREDRFCLQAFILSENRLKLTWERICICVRITALISLHFTGIINFCRQSLNYI